MKKSKIKGIFLRALILIFAVVLVLVLPGLDFLSKSDMNYIYSTFIGKKSEYNGVLEIWNVDSFESGLKSKTSYIEYCAEKFQKQNKGVYVLIRNLTEGECLNLLESGTYPDLLSCSYGLSDKVNGYMRAYESNNVNIGSNFLNAGIKSDGNLYGLAWCVGYYCLISTKTKLEKAGKSETLALLNEIAYESEYEYKVGKNTKKSVSITFGEGGYLMPKDALNAYNIARSIHTENQSESELSFRSQYSAYGAFLNNEATILLGTHRDICRMMAREESGKISDVVYLPLTNWTDLVQFTFILNKTSELRSKYAEKFALFLVEEENQKQVEKIGMFPVISVNETSNKGVMRDIILENFSVLEPKSLFM